MYTSLSPPPSLFHFLYSISFPLPRSLFFSFTHSYSFSLTFFNITLSPLSFTVSLSHSLPKTYKNMIGKVADISIYQHIIQILIMAAVTADTDIWTSSAM